MRGSSFIYLAVWSPGSPGRLYFFIKATKTFEWRNIQGTQTRFTDKKSNSLKRSNIIFCSLNPVSELILYIFMHEANKEGD